MSERRAAVGLGSNVGDRHGFLLRAINSMDRLAGVRVLGTSRLYDSAGWGREGLAPFLNAAVAVGATGWSPEDLLAELQGIENALGRQRELKWGPRTIDLDLLAFDGEARQTDFLQLPHPWIARRPFVYMPLRDLADLDPRWGRLCEPTEEGRAIEEDTRPAPQPPFFWGRRRTDAPAARTTSVDGTEALGRRMSLAIQPGDTVALAGGLGAGKTALARGIARGLGVEGPVPSPSYTLCRVYTLEDGTSLEHWDFYRLESEADLESAGFDPRPGAPVIRVIEWADRFPGALAGNVWRLRLESGDGADERTITPEGEVPFLLSAALEVAAP